MGTELHFPQTSGMPVWHDSAHISALSDDERHLGHIVHTERWHAWDATKPNTTGDGMRYLGGFESADEAKKNVERSLAISMIPSVHRAGGVA